MQKRKPRGNRQQGPSPLKLTCRDSGLLKIVEQHLASEKCSWLEIRQENDYSFGEHQFAIYFATLCLKIKNIVFEAWVIIGGGIFSYYNFDNYPHVEDAIAQHIGRLYIRGIVKLT